MTHRVVVRTETRQTAGERYPYEVGYTETGTWVIPDYHLGRWTGRATDDPCTPAGGPGRISRDDLNVSVVSMALRDGQLTPAASAAAARLAVGGPAQ